MAFLMKSFAQNDEDSALQLEDLRHLKDKVNTIGREIAALEKQRANLTECQAKALDSLLPAVQFVAAESTAAIKTFNTNRNHLFASAYVDETEQILKDADRVRMRFAECDGLLRDIQSDLTERLGKDENQVYRTRCLVSSRR
jgi:hypothetical protein